MTPKYGQTSCSKKVNKIYLWIVSIYEISNRGNIMKIPEKTVIIVETTVHAPIEAVWKLWTEPFHIIHWNNASDDWLTTRTENDLRVDGRFLSRMEARDGSHGFDFSGKYTRVDLHKQIESTLDDGRNVQVLFLPRGNMTAVTEAFEAEQENSVELQKEGWQAILNNFKKYVEAHGK